MRRLLASFVIMGLLLATPASADTAVTLRDHIEASGPAVTLGDVFDGAGAASARAIAPAPPPGLTSTLSPAVIAASASAAGLDWTPPAGLHGVQVTRTDGRANTRASAQSSGIRATLPASPNAQFGGRSVPDAAVHRGEMVLLVYAIPGVQLSTRARALEDGAIGQDIRLVNLTSNRTIDATVTGPGAANAAPPQ